MVICTNLYIFVNEHIKHSNMYEEYIKSERTPAGKVLEHILRKAKITQKQLSIKTGVYPQRISELIRGTRGPRWHFAFAQVIITTPEKGKGIPFA